MPDRVLRVLYIDDDPGLVRLVERSLRGRTVTHAFHFDLGLGPLPPLRATADATEALWLPLGDALAWPEDFFEDHHAIIEHFLMRG